jgi:hypothetical protein
MEKENKEKQYAWIVLRENPPASIDLSNSFSPLYDIEGTWLQGFEWTVLTIKNNREERIYIADSFLEAKKWVEKNGYDIHCQNDDPSKMLIQAIYTTTKKTVDELELEKNIKKLIEKAEDGITPYEPSVNDYDKCLSNNGEMKGRIEAFCEVLKLLNKKND